MLARASWFSKWGAAAGVLIATFTPAALAEPKEEWVSGAVLKDQKGFGWVLAFSPDGKTLAATCGGTDILAKKKIPVSVRLWDIETQKVTATFFKDGSDICGMAYTTDGKQIVAACFDGNFRRFDVESGKAVDSVAMGDRISLVWFSPDRKLVLLPAAKDTKPGQPPPPHQYQLVEVDTGKKIDPAKPFPTTAPVLALAPKATMLAINVALPPDPKVKLPPGVSVAGGRLESHLWDAATGEKSEPLTKQSVSQAHFSPDGKVLLLVCYDGPSGKRSVQFWDVAEKKMHAGKIPYTRELRNFAFTDDGALVAATCDDGTIRIWETKNMKEVAVLEGHTTPAQAIVFSPDGNTLATAEADGAIRLWRRKGR